MSIICYYKCPEEYHEMLKHFGIEPVHMTREVDSWAAGLELADKLCKEHKQPISVTWNGRTQFYRPEGM